jgi:hypothetical protein
MCAPVEMQAVIPYPGPLEDFAFQVAAKGLARPTVVVRFPGEPPEVLKRYHTLCASVIEATSTSSPMRGPLAHRAIRSLGGLGFYRDGLSLALSTRFSPEFIRAILFDWFIANPVVATTYVYTMTDTELRDVALDGLTYFFCHQTTPPGRPSLEERQRHIMLWLQRALTTATMIKNTAQQETSLTYIFTYFQYDQSIEFLFENDCSEAVYSVALPLLRILLDTRDSKSEAPNLASCFPIGERRDQLVMPLYEKAFLKDDLETATALAQLFSKKHEKNTALYEICKRAVDKKDRWAFNGAFQNLDDPKMHNLAKNLYKGQRETSVLQG